MAQTKTLGQIISRVQRDLNLEDEQFLPRGEVIDYINEAIDFVESEIHTLGREDTYFLTSANIALVEGTSTYNLPSDIFGQKIKGIVYHNGTDIYPILPMTFHGKFSEKELIDQYASSNDYYQYFITHGTAGTWQIQLVPTAQETSSTNVVIWYIRNAKSMPNNDPAVAGDNDTICDIPEFTHYVIAYAKMMCAGKEFDPRYEVLARQVDEYRRLMHDTLSNAIDDGYSDILEKDLTHYSNSDDVFR